jgi:methyl-accepting chemotaxis protein
MACAFALFQASRIQANAIELKDNWFPALNRIDHVGLKIESVRRSTLSLLLAQDSTEKDDRRKKHDEAVQQLTADIQAYEKMANPGHDRELFDVDKTTVSRFLTLDTNIVRMASADDADFTTVRLMVNSASQEAFYAAKNALESHAKWLTAEADEAGNNAIQIYHQAISLTLVAVALAIVASIFIANYISASIVRPISRAVEVAESIAKGDLSMKQNRNTLNTELGQLNRAFVNMAAQLIHIVSQVRTGSDAVLNGTAEIAAGNENLSQRTEEQAASVEQTVASVQNLTTIVQSNASNATQGLSLAKSTSDLANRGGKVMRDVIETMIGISTQSNKVAAIINTIEGIAFQTNILALNAAVEAARAGNEGRGFAVVAQEVRTLAQRSASAAKEIKELVTDSVTQINAGSTLVNDAGNAIDEMVREFRHVSDLMNEITAASTEGHQGLLEVNQAIGEIDSVAQHNAALVEQASAAARNVQEEANRLRNLVAIFSLP